MEMEDELVTVMKERKLKILAQKNQERKLKLEKRKELKTSQNVEEENINFILTKFEHLEAEIRSCLKQIEDINVPKESLPELFDSCYCKLEEWQKMISLTSHVMKIYHKKQFQVKYQELNDRRLKLEQNLIPHKKFSFTKIRSKNSKNETGDKEVFPKITKDEVDAVVDKPVKRYNLKIEEFGFSHRENDELFLTHEETKQKDVTFRDLNSCKVQIEGGANTVHFISLVNCRVLCGPVSTSIFVEKCSNCTLVVACQQLRVHHTFDTDFYVHVTSRAIIEDSERVGFAPYNWKYDGIEKHFEFVDLDMTQNNWNLVNDFNWLSTVQSPNWKIIEESKRLEWD